ncbi:MAG: hypothetical protein LBT40_11875 [Deltaproteobacteria bacterium]|jgi:carbonic anhydrase|nr:hypothetical protein [Deltaproteobacteria bacterium]
MIKRIRFSALPLCLCLFSTGARAAMLAGMVAALITVMASSPASAQSDSSRRQSALPGAVDFGADPGPPAAPAPPEAELPAATDPVPAAPTDPAAAFPTDPAAAVQADPAVAPTEPVAAPAEPAPASEPAPGHEEPAGGHEASSGHGGNPWTAQSAMTVLSDGNARFVGGGVSCRDPQAEKNLRHALVEGQTPLAAILSCSDSRVPVEEIFDMNFGDIFSIRAAGSVPGVDQLGSIEYAVAHLGVPLVVVLAHTHCGAVTAAVQGANEPGNLGELLHKLDPITQAVKDVADADKINAAIYLSARRFTEQLPALSPVIKEAIDAGRLTIVDAVYDLDTGKVLFHPQTQP